MKLAGAVALLLAGSLLVALACSGGSTPPSPESSAAIFRIQTKVVDLGPLRIDQIYRSMDGPFERAVFDPSGIGWVTRFRTEVLDLESDEPIGEEFFCHSQLQLGNLTRLLVTATGISEIRFPEGFGMPLKQILSGVPAQWRGLSLLGMVLNNHDPDMDREVKVRVTLDYISDSGTGTPPEIKKLYKVGVPTTLENAIVLAGDPPRPSEVELYKGLKGHWMVPPGPQIVRQRHRNLVPVPSRVHYALVHLHNHGRSMRLTDLTEGKVLWQTDTVYEPGRVQIAKIPIYSSAEGFLVYPDHEYEIQVSYHNTSSEPVDAMAAMYLYYHPLGNEDITYPSPPPSFDTAHH